MAPDADRPFPPGEYPVVVVGSGPGGLQVSYFLRRQGVAHAVLSADPAPGGMFRRWPFFQRLLSWTKPYAPEARDQPRVPAVRLEQPARRRARACARSRPSIMDGTSYFPSRPEMEANLATFADARRIAVRYDCRWERDPARGRPTGTSSCSRPPTASIAAAILVFAVGVAEPWTPRPAGHRARPPLRGDARRRRRYAGKRVFIIGKQNSGFELASGLRRGRRRSSLARRRRRSCPSRRIRWSGSGPATSSRSRTTSWAAACSILDASIDGIVARRAMPSASTSGGPTRAADWSSRPTR